MLTTGKALEKREKLIQEEEMPEIIENYLSEMPSIQKYVDSNKSYEEMPIIENFIFTELLN